MLTKRIELNPCMGVPVIYDPSMRSISDSRGLWRWKKIFVGRNIFAFPPREQQAIVFHELGHCKLRHLEQRIKNLWMILFRPKLLAELCIKQEYEADQFAARAGFGQDLARAFLKLKTPGDPLHPPLQERIGRLLAST